MKVNILKNYDRLIQSLLVIYKNLSMKVVVKLRNNY